MPENSESKEPREMSTEEVLLRDDIKDIFQANANIAGIGSLEAGIAATTLVGWLIPSEDFINPLITVTQAVIRANELTIPQVSGLFASSCKRRGGIQDCRQVWRR